RLLGSGGGGGGGVRLGGAGCLRVGVDLHRATLAEGDGVDGGGPVDHRDQPRRGPGDEVGRQLQRVRAALDHEGHPPAAGEREVGAGGGEGAGAGGGQVEGGRADGGVGGESETGRDPGRGHRSTGV